MSWTNNNKPKEKANTRYGYTCGSTTRLDMGEERFRWQRPPNAFDAIYKVTLDSQVRDLHFGTSTREDWKTTMINKRDSFNPNAGPGSYKLDKEFLVSSEMHFIEAPRFQDAPRESMALKTCTPGPIYNIEKVYKRGKEESLGVSFGRSKRKNLHASSAADALYAPKLDRPDFAVSFGAGDRFHYEPKFSLTMSTPGPIYNVNDPKCIDNIKIRPPSIVWGKGRGSRFKTDSIWGN